MWDAGGQFKTSREREILSLTASALLPHNICVNIIKLHKNIQPSLIGGSTKEEEEKEQSSTVLNPNCLCDAPNVLVLM